MVEYLELVFSVSTSRTEAIRRVAGDVLVTIQLIVSDCLDVGSVREVESGESRRIRRREHLSSCEKILGSWRHN